MHDLPALGKFERFLVANEPGGPEPRGVLPLFVPAGGHERCPEESVQRVGHQRQAEHVGPVAAGRVTFR